MYKDKLIGSKGCLSKALYIVPTPIGNLEDITMRALRILREVDWLACEDTRITANLLNMYDIQDKKMLIYNDYASDAIKNKIISLLDAGKSVALVSDAGTPLVSDPGYKLIQMVKSMGHKVNVLPGACSVITALLLSGMPTDKFCFVGFPPNKSGKRQNFFAKLIHANGTLIFFERASRCKDFLEDALSIFGNRKVAIVREMTKIYEEVIDGTIRDVIGRSAGQTDSVLREDTLSKADKHQLIPSHSQSQREQLRGEIVILISREDNKMETGLCHGHDKVANNPKNDVESDDYNIKLIIKKLACQNLSNKDVVEYLVTQLGINKKLAYKAVLREKE